jgi:hypothetical protein
MKALEVLHDPGGPGGNVLCLNGSAHARYTSQREYVDCPACLKMIETGCSAVEASKVWHDWKQQQLREFATYTGQGDEST